MKLTVNRESLLKPLTLVVGAVERRQTLPILSNILLQVESDQLSITGTDMEVELSATLVLPEPAAQGGQITVPAKKLLDICKSLPEDCDISISLDDARLEVKSGRSRFQLVTLPASDFPATPNDDKQFAVALSQRELKRVIDATAFSMAQQDVRYYLNGMLWELSSSGLKAVATDGHRLAIASASFAEKPKSLEAKQVIVPRKGVLELARLLGETDEPVSVAMSDNHIRAEADGIRFIAKLVDGKFPDYQRVLPKGGNKEVMAERQTLRSALARTAILSNEKFRGVRLNFDKNALCIQANNPEQEEAHEEVAIDYSSDTVEMGFNVGYLIDVLGVLNATDVKITLTDANSSALIEDGDADNNAVYVVMPMRL